MFPRNCFFIRFFNCVLSVFGVCLACLVVTSFISFAPAPSKNCLRRLSIIPLLLLSPKSLSDFSGTPGCTVFARRIRRFHLNCSARCSHLSEKQTDKILRVPRENVPAELFFCSPEKKPTVRRNQTCEPFLYHLLKFICCLLPRVRFRSSRLFCAFRQAAFQPPPYAPYRL